MAGVLEALPSASLSALGAADFGFCSGVDSEVVRAFVTSRGSLTRCNLRAATKVSAAVYNEVGQLAQARVGATAARQAAASTSTIDNVIENRRRPKSKPPREAAPFFYLKR